LPLDELPEWYDIDDDQGFLSLKNELVGKVKRGGYQALHTRAMLTKILPELPSAWEDTH